MRTTSTTSPTLTTNVAPLAAAGHDAADERAWRKVLAPYKRSSRRRALAQLANTALPFAALWALAAWAFQFSYLWTLLLAIPAAGLFIRLFIIQHDCGHGSFFRSAKANNGLGGVLGVVTLFPYGYWRRTHAIHHATNGNLDDREFGDIRTLTVAEYRALGRWRRLAYRLYRNPLVLFGVGPFWQFVVKHRFPFDIPWSWKREWKSVLWTNVAIAAAVAGLVALIGWPTFLAVHLTIIALAGPLGVWLFYVQHQFEDTYWEHADAWDFYRAGAHGSSFYDLPRVLHWWTGNIGYHHIHHLASRIPNYHLREAFEENPQLQRVTRLTLKDSLRCARLRLWDEERRSMIGWRELREGAAGEETSAAA
ncbi:MAG TPA: fatty acid desaturase [Thermoanaerobaculia bacterium]